MSDFEFINYSTKNRVATVAFNSPASLNALHQKMRLEIMQAIDLAEGDDDIRVVVITGEGRAFCAGADLSEGMPGHDSFVDQCAAEYTPWLMAIHNSDKIYISAVNGVVAGIGGAIAMNCDLMMMADDAYMYQAFSAIGLIPDGGANWLLLQKLGYQRAFELAVDAGKLTAQECLQLGVANKVVDADSLPKQAQKWAEHLAEGAPLAQKSLKQLMRKAHNMSYKDVVEEEAVLQSALIKSEDSRAAIEAFFAQEKANFKGV